MKKQNGDFICEICGKPDMVMSEIRLSCNYGSKHDGERVTLSICGACADKIFNVIQKESEK